MLRHWTAVVVKDTTILIVSLDAHDKGDAAERLRRFDDLLDDGKMPKDVQWAILEGLVRPEFHKIAER